MAAPLWMFAPMAPMVVQTRSRCRRFRRHTLGDPAVPTLDAPRICPSCWTLACLGSDNVMGSGRAIGFGDLIRSNGLETSCVSGILGKPMGPGKRTISNGPLWARATGIRRARCCCDDIRPLAYRPRPANKHHLEPQRAARRGADFVHQGLLAIRPTARLGGSLRGAGRPTGARPILPQRGLEPLKECPRLRRHGLYPRGRTAAMRSNRLRKLCIES